MKLYYLSFCDTDAPKGQQWLGGAYVEAESLDHAVFHVSRHHGCNPGGEVMSVELPIDSPIKPSHRNRLLNEAELRASGPEDDRALITPDGTLIPEKH